MSNATLNLTADELKSLVATAVSAAVQEARKPDPPTEKEAIDLKMKQEHRQKLAESILQVEERKRHFQNQCAHEHARREGGGTHCVYVREEDPRSPGYILCQKCQARIRPEGSSGLDKNAIYNNMLFNKLLQDCGEATLMLG